MSERERDDDELDAEVRDAEVLDASSQVHTPADEGGRGDLDRQGYADREYGFSGRDGFREGDYSGYYGRGMAGERDAPSASGYGGAGYERGGTDVPAPDREPTDAERADDESADRRDGLA